VPRFGSVLEAFDRTGIQVVPSADLLRLTLVSLIANNSLSGWDLGQQAAFLPIDANVIRSRRKWPVDPNEFIVVN
jgi:hypothetical protein